MPIPFGQKGPRILGWPGLTWEDLADWIARGCPADSLGLRLDIWVMIDLDINDRRTAERAEDQLRDLIGEDVALVVRWRSDSPRIAILVRLKDPENAVSRLTTSKWPEGRIEFLSGPGRQMLAFGRHPEGATLKWDLPDGQTTTDPEDFPPSEELHALTSARVAEICDAMEAWLHDQLGEPLEPQIKSGNFDYAFDLEPDARFTTNHGEVYTLDDLRPYVGPEGRGPPPFVNLTPWRAESDSMGGLPGWSYDRECMIVTDFPRGIVHAERIADPAMTVELDLGTVESFTAPEEAQKPRHESEYVYVRDQHEYLLRAKPLSVRVGPAAMMHGKTRKAREAIHERVPCAVQTIWDPALPPQEIIETSYGIKAFNTYTSPAWVGQGDITPFRALLQHLGGEHASILESWIAYKVQHPWERLFPVALVGPPASGKTTLWRILQAVWTPEQVSLTGTMESALKNQFHDYLLNKVYALFDEVTEADIGTHQGARKKAANVLKVIGDTSATTQLLNAKYGRQRMARVCATVGVTTNEPDALALTDADRRWLILQTGDALPNAATRTRYGAWADAEANRAAFFRFYQTFDVTGFDSRTPPKTEAHTRMIDLGKSELDEAAEEFVALVAQSGGFTTQQQIEAFCEIRQLHGPKRNVVVGIIRKTLPCSRPFRLETKVVKIRSLDTAPWGETGYKKAVTNALGQLDLNICSLE